MCTSPVILYGMPDKGGATHAGALNMRVMIFPGRAGGAIPCILNLGGGHFFMEMVANKNVFMI